MKAIGVVFLFASLALLHWLSTTTPTVHTLAADFGVGDSKFVNNDFGNMQESGHIIIDKVTNPSGDPQSFSFWLAGGPSALNQSFGLADATPPHDSGLVLPGSGYNASETVPAGWQLTSATCSDGSPASNINVDPGETVTCTFTNTKYGRIIVRKVTVGGDDSFTFDTNYRPDFNLSNGQQNDSSLAPGTYSVAEVGIPAGWQLTSATCDDGSVPGSIGLAAGETVTCTFTNTLGSPPTLAFRWPWAGGEPWKYTGGPHGSWAGVRQYALDFQPQNVSGCVPAVDTGHWVYPIAAGTVIDARHPVGDYGEDQNTPVSLMIDHGNGYVSYTTHLANTTVSVQWNPDWTVKSILNPHIAANTPLGNPSCYHESGGSASGRHVHVALRKDSSWDAMLSTPFCGWAVVTVPNFQYPAIEGEQASGVADVHPLRKSGKTDVYPLYDGQYVWPPNGKKTLQMGSVANEGCPVPGSVTRVMDQVHRMQTGDRQSGQFVVDLIVGVTQVLRILVGPFFSDLDLVVTRPDGSQVAPTDPGVEYVKTDNSVSVTIHDAPTGQWSYEIIADQLEPGGEDIRIVADESNGASAVVGGMAELPDIAEGDPSVPNYIALSALAAAALLALTAGGWYARRRWL